MELPATLRSLAAQASGVMVVGIRPERQVKYSDIFIGDILLEVAGKAVKDNAILLATLAASQERERLAVKLLRGGTIVETEIATLLLEYKK
jgi:S1-C subfamily serine protease